MLGYIITLILFFIIGSNYIYNIHNIHGGNELPKFGIEHEIIRNWVFEYFDKVENQKINNPPTLTYDKLIYNKAYEPSKNIWRTSIHLGQRKLFLTELQHLCNICRASSEKLLVVYAGAAAGIHSGYIFDLFPRMKWLGVDPNEFAINRLNKSESESHKPLNTEIVNEKRQFIDELSDTHYTINNDVLYLRPKDYELYPISKPKNMKVWDFNLNKVIKWVRGDKRTEEFAINADKNMRNIAKIIATRKERIFLWEDYMGNDLADALFDLHKYFDKIIFWSDIRTSIIRDEQFIRRKWGDDKNSMTRKVPRSTNESGENALKFEETGEENGPTNLDVLWNSAQQFNWIFSLRPHYYMLKFRPYFIDRNAEMMKETKDWRFIKKFQNGEIDKLPLEWIAHLGADPENYPNIISDLKLAKSRGVDFLEDYKNCKLRCVAGEVYIQPFCGPSSTEVRLHGFAVDDPSNIEISIDKIYKMQNYDSFDFEERVFWYNNIDRPFIHHKNEYSNPDTGFDHCNDCAIEANIWENFMKFYDFPQSKWKEFIPKCVKRLTIATNGISLLQKNHGKFFKPYTSEILKTKVAKSK